MLRPLARSAAAEAPRIMRFLVVGILNTAFGYSLYLVGLWAGFAPTVALAFATFFGALFNYLSVGSLVFHSTGMVKLPAFAGAYIVIYSFNALLLHILMRAHVAPWLAQMLALPPVVAANYGLMRVWVFRSPR